jgi:hypothetical protein
MRGPGHALAGAIGSARAKVARSCTGLQVGDRAHAVVEDDEGQPRFLAHDLAEREPALALAAAGVPPLFNGPTLPAIFAMHLNHDGNPPELEWLRKHDRHAPLAELLDDGLAHEPGERISMATMRARLQEIAKETLADSTWPLRP